MGLNTIESSFLLLSGPNRASSRVRGFELAEAMGARGSASRVVYPGMTGYRRAILEAGLGRGALVIQKRAGGNDRRIAGLRRRLGLPTIFDLDDGPGGIAESRKAESWVTAIMEKVDAVTVGGEELRQFAQRHSGNVHVIPSAVDADVFRPPEPVTGDGGGKDRGTDVGLHLGWIGDGRGYWEDLAPLAGVLAELRREGRVRLSVLGAAGRREIYETFRHEDDRIVDQLPWTDNRAVAEAMADFDVGLYPLRDTRYNAYKCGYKALQYMAIGLPVVASPVSETARIVRDGISGFLVRTSEEWRGALERLRRNPRERSALGHEGRRIVEREYSLDVVAPRMIELVRSLARNRADERR